MSAFHTVCEIHVTGGYQQFLFYIPSTLGMRWKESRKKIRNVGRKVGRMKGPKK
jgi:hypothetical protein